MNNYEFEILELADFCPSENEKRKQTNLIHLQADIGVLITKNGKEQAVL